MKLRFNLILVLALFLNISAFGQTSNHIYKNISAIEFKNQVNKNKQCILLDVRTPEEFAKGFIAGAININYFDKNFKEQVQKLAPNKPIYVYCAVGGRSAKASALIAGLNQKEVYNLEGGFTAWQKLNYPIQK